MARVRVLIALILIAAGSTVGALALSGYYDAPMPRGQAVTASAAGGAPVSGEEPRLTLSRWAGRLQAAEEKPKAAPSPPPKPKAAAAKPAPAKPRVAASGVPPVKRPQEAAAPWPWQFFRN